MRDFGGVCSRAVFGAVFGIAAGLAVAAPEAWAQEDDAAAPAEPVAIEIIGEAAEAPADGTDSPTGEAPAKGTEQQPSGDLAPMEERPLAAMASTGDPEGEVGAAAAESRENVDPFIGSFSTVVSIDLPPFHGIEPNLALTYNSSRGNGFIGLGWELSGLSVIERASRGRGAPRHDANDIFLLDGQEFVPCVAGTTSPSCDTGGTHTTEIESYLRIKQDMVANTWEISSRDGTKTTYAAVMGPNTLTTAGTYRWARTGVVDTHGNAVTYDWWCDGTPAVECYPDTITYNGVTVRFYREARTDPVSYANGSALSRTNFRLKTIDVLVSTDRARVYALEYAASEATAQSRLTDIAAYGRDVVLDGAGIVSGGSSLPPTSITWGEEGGETFATADWGQPCTSVEGLADFNGDGRDDVFCQLGYNTWISLSNGDGSFATTANYSVTWCAEAHETEITWRFADFNGDGFEDFQCTRKHTRTNNDGDRTTITKHYGLSNGNGTIQVLGATDRICDSEGLFGGNADVELFGDFNGDGRADRFCKYVQSRERNNGDSVNEVFATVYYSQGNGTFSATHLGQICGGSYRTAPTIKMFVHDLNGDGLADASCNQNGTHYSYLSNPNGSFRTVSAGYTCGYATGSADFNGDGKADLYCQYNNTGQVRISLSLGNGRFSATTSLRSVCGPYSGYNFGFPLSAGDFNGDGRDDLHCLYQNQNYISLSDGAGGFSAAPVWSWCGMPPYVTVAPAELDGDGKSDLYCRGNADPNAILVAISGGLSPNLVTTVTPPPRWVAPPLSLIHRPRLGPTRTSRWCCRPSPPLPVMTGAATPPPRTTRMKAASGIKRNAASSVSARRR